MTLPRRPEVAFSTTIPGRVRGKKNRQKIGDVKLRDGTGRTRKVMIRSEVWVAWARGASQTIKRSVLGPPPWPDDQAFITGEYWRLYPALWPTESVSVAAVYHPPRQGGVLDLSGMLESVGDMLEMAGVITNDRQVESWDGSRIRARSDEPRLELQVVNLERPPTPIRRKD